MGAMATSPSAPSRARGRLLALLLFVAAPVCAEYLQAYDPEVTGKAAALVFGLVILGPLYGGPALLIREVAARTGMHWTGILALAGAFGVVQAGVVDQSLFATSYLDYADWDEMLRPTFVAPLGIGAALALNFLVGHALWSFGAPIALAECLDRPGPRRPWLRAPGLVTVTVLWLVAALLVWSDIRGAGSDQASAAQLAGALVVAGVLAGVAFTVGRRPLPTPTDALVPRPLAVLGLALIAGVAFSLVPPTWLGVALGVAILVVAAAAVTHWSRSGRWEGRHVAALAGGAVLSRALVGFVSVAQTTPRPPGGLTQNTVLLVLSLALVAAAVRGPRSG